MKALTLIVICAAFVGIPVSPTLAAEAEAYLLLNVESDGILSARDLVYTNVESGEDFLSSIYPNMNVNDIAPCIEVDHGDDIIILAGTIN